MDIESKKFYHQIDLLPALAKVNLSLDVIGRLPNGLHCIQSLICPISLHDKIKLELFDAAKGPSSCLVRFSPKLATHLDHKSHQSPAAADYSSELNSLDNLAARAAQRFLSLFHSGDALNFRIELEKHIPFEAGLGGGSADAASVLQGLCSWAGVELRSAAVLELAASLGADVPGMLCRKLSAVEGSGSRVLDLLNTDSNTRKLEGRELIILKPFTGVSTAKAYASLNKSEISIPNFEELETASIGSSFIIEPTQRFLELCRRLLPDFNDSFFLNSQAKALTYLSREGTCLSPGLAAGIAGEKASSDVLGFYNDFQEVVCAEYAQVAKAISVLQGIAGLDDVVLSGSGSAVFAVVKSSEIALHLLEEVRQVVPDAWFVEACRFLPSGHLE